MCLSHLHPDPAGMLSHSLGLPSRREGPPSIWDTHGMSGKRFCKSRCVFISTISPRIASMEFIDRRAAPFVHSGEKVKGKNKIKIWDASLGRQPKIQPSSVEETLQRIMGADQQRLQILDLHFDKFPTPATFACWKVRFKTEVCTCSQFPTEAMQWIKEVELVDSVDELRTSSSIRGISNAEFWSTWCEDCFSIEPNHP